VALKVHIVASGGKRLYCVVINCKPNGRACAKEYKLLMRESYPAKLSFEDTRCALRVKKKTMI